MHARRSWRYPAGLALAGVVILGMPIDRAAAEPQALDDSYKQSGKLATSLAQQYDSAIRQTVVRLGELTRQTPADLARNPLALETSRSQWPIATYLLTDGKPSVVPAGRPLLSADDLREAAGRKSRVFVRDTTVIVVVPASAERFTAAEIPLTAFTAPLEGFSPKGGALALLDADGRQLGRNTLGSEDHELIRSLGTDASTTLVSKTSLLSLSHIPAAGWTVVVRVPLTEAYQGIAVPELDERALPYPLYTVKRAERSSLAGLGQSILMTFGGLGFLILGLLVIRQRLKNPRPRPPAAPFAETEASGGGAPEGSPSLLESLVGEKRIEKRSEPASLAAAPSLPLLQAPTEGAAAGVWRDTMQAQISYLQSEQRKTQDQLKGVVQPHLGALQARMESEFESMSEALRKRLELESQRIDRESHRLESLENTARERLSEFDLRLNKYEESFGARTLAMETRLEDFVGAVDARFTELTSMLRSRFEQEDHLLASLDQELTQVRGELEAIWAQQRQASEQQDGKLGALEREFEGYRQQGIAADRQAFERIEALTKGLQDMHGKLAAAQRDGAEFRSELEALSERVHRVVKLIAKGRPS